jgi:uncharacterized protein with HEPN domain
MKDNHNESFKRLEHTLAAIENIEKYCLKETLSSFENDDKLNNAVLFNFTVIGEAILHVENEILGKYNYSWYKVIAFRNLIAHEYFNIKMRAVWEIIQNDLPQLKEKVIEMIKDNNFDLNA